MSHHHEMSDNPYAPVAVDPPRVAPMSDAAMIRKKHLSHEASIKSIGSLYLLAAFILVPIGVWMIFAALLSSPGPVLDDAYSFIISLFVGVFQIALGVCQGLTGLGLRQLKNWARIVAIIFSAIGLLGFPFGTLISAYFLYLLLSGKGVYIFSDQYQQVIAATPDMQYKTSLIVWIFLILVLLFIIAAVVTSFAT